jgi:ferredoxin-NADP reductase
VIWSSLGGLIVIGVLAQLGLLTAGNIRGLRGRRRQSALDLQLLETQLGIMRDLRRKRAECALPWNGYRKFQVSKKILESQDVCSFYLIPHDRKPLPDFFPGQYLTFKLDIPSLEKPTIRCYSLSDAAQPDQYRVTIKRLVDPKGSAPAGLASSFFHERVHEGDILDVKAPSGNFFLDCTCSGAVVLVGGGIGVTPVLSMLNSLIAQRVNREIWFFYCVRNRAEHAMKEHLETVARENANVHLRVCCTQPEPDYHPGAGYQHQGRLSIEVLKQNLPSSNFSFYICGPGPMMQSITEGLKTWGVPERNIHFETFGPSSVKAIAPPETAGATALTVHFKKSGRTAQWNGRHANLLEFAEANGIAIPCGCRAGSCGTCLVAVYSGEVAYAEKSDFETGPGARLTCIGIPRSDVVLDA